VSDYAMTQFLADNPAVVKQATGRKTKTSVLDLSPLLITTKEGTPRALLANAITVLRHHPDWSGVLAFNEFSLRVVNKKALPWSEQTRRNWADCDDSLCADWLQHNGVLVNSKVAGEAAQTVAHENGFHPVRDYLTALRWDGKSRLDSLLVRYLGAEDKPFTRAVGARWPVSAIARVFRPGCQVDHTLLLEGPQGIRKSTFLRVLAGDEWFTDHVSDLGSKDSRIELLGKWILEMGELDKVRRGELERVKAFLTARIDHFRVPYGRRAEDVPRSCVFAASTNDQSPLTDESGNRRFWPVRCGRILIDDLTRDRDQIWAEAYKRYAAGSPWWFDTQDLHAAATDEQERRYDAGPWDEVILTWLDEPTQRYEKDSGNSLPVTPFVSTRDGVTVTDVLLHAIGKPLDRFTQADRNQVSRCLIHNGWTRKQAGSKEHRGTWFYVRPNKSDSREL
jgi:putative DNA primase/helicase